MSKKILTPIIVILILAAGIGVYFVFQKNAPSEKTLYVLWAVHVEGDTQECQIGQPCCQKGFYQERGFELMDVQGLENLQGLSENHIDSFGGRPKMYLSPAGEFIETEMDSQYGGKTFRKYDWLALGHEIGPQPHMIYWSGEKFCWPTREMSKEGITKKLTTLHQWAEKWYHNGQKVNHGLTYAPGMKLELPIFGKDSAALTEAEKFIDKEAYNLGYRISMEDWDAYVEDNPAPGQRIPYLYQANYDDGTTMYKIGFQGPPKASCTDPSRCESPQNAKAWIDNLIKKMKADTDPAHLYYYAFTTHPYNPPPPENYLQGEEIQGTLQVFEYLDELVKSGVKIKYITPKDFVSLYEQEAGVVSFRDSPFGIFNPYEVFLDRPEFITQADINNYVKDLGVPWVQGMPFDLDSLAQTGSQLYSRIIPLEKPVNYDKEIEFWTEIIRKNKGRVKYWEIDTEPESCPLPKEQGAEGCWKKPEDYAEYQKTFYGIIKKECPDCTVVFGGIGGPEVGFTEDSPQAKWLKSALAASKGKYFDAFEFKQHYHKANEYTELKNKMDVYGKILSEYGIDIKKIPIFIETAMYDGTPVTLNNPPLPYQSELQQAAGLIKTYIFGTAHGIDKIFWNYVVERGPEQGSKKEIFNYYGLVNNPDNDGLSHKKLSYYAYKKMIEILEDSDWNNIQTIQEKNGVYIYKFTKQGKPIWVVWNDNSEAKQITILGITSSKIKITEAVPKYKSGKEVTDYNYAFAIEIKSVQNGQVTFGLKDIPVFLEDK